MSTAPARVARTSHSSTWGQAASPWALYVAPRRYHAGWATLGHTVKLSSTKCRQVMHEILHALGQGHEQSRSDRDQYVEIVYEKIQDGMAHNFKISTTGSDTSQGYDIMSLMHYSSTAFSKDGSKTIKVTNEAKACEL